MERLAQSAVRAIAAIVLLGFALAFVFVALVMAGLAIYITVEDQWGAAAAAGTVAGVAVVIALILAGFAFMLVGRSSRPPPVNRPKRADRPPDEEDMVDWVRRHPREAMVTGALAGLVYSLAPGTRPMIERMVTRTAADRYRRSEEDG